MSATPVVYLDPYRLSFTPGERADITATLTAHGYILTRYPQAARTSIAAGSPFAFVTSDPGAAVLGFAITGADVFTRSTDLANDARRVLIPWVNGIRDPQALAAGITAYLCLTDVPPIPEGP